MWRVFKTKSKLITLTHILVFIYNKDFDIS